jgi:heptosyltransferase-2
LVIKNNRSISLDYNGIGYFFDKSVVVHNNLEEHFTNSLHRLLIVLFKDINNEEDTKLKLDKDYKKYINIGIKEGFDFINDNYVVMHIGARENKRMGWGEEKRWPYDRYIAVGEFLYKSHNLKSVFVGTIDELPDHNVGTKKSDWAIYLFGKTSVKDLLLLLSKAVFFLGNDSGIAHLAGLLNIPALVIYGFTSHFRTKPLGYNTKIISLSLPCSPCMYWYKKRPCKGTSWETMCIKGISTDYVIKEIENLLRSKITLNNTGKRF